MKHDVIFIRELYVETIVGVYSEERLQKQPILIDIDLFVDNRTAALSDTILDAVDYEAVVKSLSAFVEQSRFQLIETLAEQIAHFILKTFNVARIRLSVQKPQALKAAKTVGITIERDFAGTTPVVPA